MVLLNLHLALLSFCFPLDFRLGQQKKVTLVSENADHEKNLHLDGRKLLFFNQFN